MDDVWGSREWRELLPARLAAGRVLTPDDAVSLDRPWVLKFRTRMTSIGFQFQVPTGITDHGGEFKFEIIARTTAGNNTAMESCFVVR